METIKKLREICQPQYPQVKRDKYFRLYKRFLRIFSIYLTKLVLYSPLNAYLINILALILGLLSATFFAYGYLITGAIVMQMWYLVDCVDGEVARYRMKNIKDKPFKHTHGLYIDLNIHHIVHPFLFIGITIGLYSQHNNFYILVLGLLSVFGLLFNDLINLNRVSSIFLEFKRKIDSIDKFIQINKLNKSSIEKKTILKTISKLFYRFPGTMNVIFIAAIFDKFYWLLIFYGITFPLVSLLKFIKQFFVKEQDMLRF